MRGRWFEDPRLRKGWHFTGFLKPREGACRRLNAQKRCTDVVGIFPHQAAITDLVGALLLEQSDERQLQRRYLALEPL